MVQKLISFTLIAVFLFSCKKEIPKEALTKEIAKIATVKSLNYEQLKPLLEKQDDKIMKLNTNQRKKFRITGKLKKVASPDRFRLSISRSAKNISAQIIDDVNRVTLVSCSSVEKDIRSMEKTNKIEVSKIVAEKLAKKAQEKKITKIYFDRGVYKYHGRVKAFADTLRKNGMEF